MFFIGDSSVLSSVVLRCPVSSLPKHLLLGMVHPRARGHAVLFGLGAGVETSIPARAGTRPAHRRRSIPPGPPSPRARGHATPGSRRSARARSIPARADTHYATSRSSRVDTGPSPRARTRIGFSRISREGWVHPRARGDTPERPLAGVAALGPSPRARGHAERAGPDRLSEGSIPARGGNTFAGFESYPVREVHPRARGEHAHKVIGFLSGFGRSPRAGGTPL